MDNKLVMSPKLFGGFILLSLYITIFGLFWPIDFSCFLSGNECLKVYGYPFVIYKLTKEGYLVGDRNIWVLMENFVFWLLFLVIFWVIVVITFRMLKMFNENIKA
jgi:hypothetical protein